MRSKSVARRFAPGRIKLSLNVVKEDDKLECCINSVPSDRNLN